MWLPNAPPFSATGAPEQRARAAHGVGHVAHDGQRSAPHGLERGARFAARAGVAIGDGDGRTVANESLGEGEAYATGAAGHNGRAAGQVESCGVGHLWSRCWWNFQSGERER